MYRSPGKPMPHISTPNPLTTINYTLEWPYLQNPSNTTFAGPTQIDMCKCPRPDLPSQNDNDPSHIYTRYTCSGPTVRFHSPDEQLWVLQAPHGPINMLRPATSEETQRRKQLSNSNDANPSVYAGRNLLFLTGPCPRGRYQAYATLQFLESLPSEARNKVECISLLVQPYEEDCSDQNCTQAYAQLAEYILHHLEGFRTLCLNIWDDEMRLRGATGEFGFLLQRERVRIVVGCSWWRGQVKEYTNVETFSEAVSTMVARDMSGRTFDLEEVEGGAAVSGKVEDQDEDGKNDACQIDRGVFEQTQLIVVDTPSARDVPSRQEERTIAQQSSFSRSDTPTAQPRQASEQSTSTQEAHLDDDDSWTEATISPTSPDRSEEGSWQVL